MPIDELLQLARWAEVFVSAGAIFYSRFTVILRDTYCGTPAPQVYSISIARVERSGVSAAFRWTRPRSGASSRASTATGHAGAKWVTKQSFRFRQALRGRKGGTASGLARRANVSDRDRFNPRTA